MSIFCRRIREVASSRFFWEGGWFTSLCIFVFEEAKEFWGEEEEEEGEFGVRVKVYFLFDLVAFREPPTAAGRRGEAKFLDFFFWVKFEFWVRRMSGYVVARCGIW